jgi:Tfp pilus assembly protein PilP
MLVKTLKFMLIYTLVQFSVCAQESTVIDTAVNTSESPTSESEGNSKFQFLNNKTFVKDPFNLRDPFRRVEPTKKMKSESSFKVDKNTFSNVKSLGDVSLDSLAIVGIFVGKERRALAKIKSGDSLGTEVYIIKEGMTIGSGSAEVKAILPGGIAIVEKITNVYNQDEYIETIIPVYSD